MATNQTFVDYQTPIPADWLNNVNNKVNILANKGTDIASAAAINLGAATGDYVVITGTTTITSFGTANAGTERTLVFSGVLTLTHNATSLILPGGADIVTDVGDIATFRSEGSGNWRCTGYQPNINGLKSNLLLSFNVGGAERMRIDTSGNVGIGGTPVAKLHSYGLMRLQQDSGSISFVSAGGVKSWYVGANINDTIDDGLHIGSGTGIGGTLYIHVTSAGVQVRQPVGLGYGPGAGGTVTQSTSKSTAVTLNKPCGQITMNAASLAAGASVSFVVNCSLMAASDVPFASIYGPSVADSNAYRLEVRHSNAGAFVLRLTNTSGGSLSEALVINFAIIKGATS
jgi:hypothetical protein